MLTDNLESRVATRLERNWVTRVFRIEWLGQTLASLCWIASVFSYGIQSNGDWLQLVAASAWLVANMAAVMTNKVD